MPKIQVWECPKTGKLFKNFPEYRRHLKKLAKINLHSRKEAKLAANAEEWFRNFRSVETSLEQLEERIIENQDSFWAAAKRTKSWSTKTRNNNSIVFPKLIGFDRFKLTWSDSVSNSHSYPIGGVMNWFGDRELPRGYPGWQGRVEWVIEWPEELDGIYHGSDLFASDYTCLNTGSGGGGSRKDGHQSYCYDLKIFEADWPGLKLHYDKIKTWNVLRNQ